MIRTIKLKLDVSPEDREALLQTMRDYTVAFNTCSNWGFTNHTANKIDLHNATYYGIRNFVPNLPASLVQCARDCACESLKHTKCKIMPERKEFSAIRYNSGVIKVHLLSGYTSISTSRGRIKLKFDFPSYYRRYLMWNIKMANLVLRNNDKEFYLYCQIEKDTPEKLKEHYVIGIDRGIVNIAVCSDNTFFNSKKVKNARAKYAHLRAELQSKGTRSAKRKLKRLSGRERRFMTDTNHCISKQIVKSDATVFSLEDLNKIRVQKRRGKELNRKLNNWSFWQLEAFIRYKAENRGKQVISVDARFTSQKCSVCGHVYKGNRNGNQFRCRACGFELHSDLNASRNIAQAGISCMSRLRANQPNATCVT